MAITCISTFMRMNRDRPAVNYTPLDIYYCIHDQQWVEAEANGMVPEMIPDIAEQLQGMQEYYQRAYGTKIAGLEERIECLNLEIEELQQYARHQKECEELLQQQIDQAEVEIHKHQGEEEVLKQLDLGQILELEKTTQNALAKIELRKMELIEANLSLVNQQRLCTICMEEERTVLLMPCRHLCLCLKCSEQNNMTNCPICRHDIETKVTVYV